MSNRHLRSANLLTRLLALNERQLNVNDDDDNDDNDGENESSSVDDGVSSNNVDEGVGVVDTAEESIDLMVPDFFCMWLRISSPRFTRFDLGSQI